MIWNIFWLIAYAAIWNALTHIGAEIRKLRKIAERNERRRYGEEDEA